jgi:hypothetical protein
MLVFIKSGEQVCVGQGIARYETESPDVKKEVFV